MAKKKEEKKADPKPKESDIYRVIFTSEGKKYESESGSLIEADDVEQVEGNSYKLKDGTLIKLVTQF